MLSLYGIHTYSMKDIATLESVQGFTTKLCTKACQGVDYSEQLRMLDLPILIRQGVTSNFVTSIKYLMDWHFYPVNCLVTFINLQCPTRTCSSSKPSNPFCSLCSCTPRDTAIHYTVKLPVLGTIHLTKLSKLPPLCPLREHVCPFLLNSYTV